MINTKRIGIITALLVMTGVCGCGAKTEEPVQEVQEYPQIAYIDNVSYYGTDNICENVPRKMPDGFIETFVDPAIMPDAYNSANFGSEQEKLEYMFLEDESLIIHNGENWYYFEKASE